ncbi:MAG: hypothetical protein ACOC2H_05230 [Spirochaetota bacterium]
MNKKLITLAVIIILDIILLAAAEKMPTIDYLALGTWDTLETDTGRIRIDFKTDKTFFGTYTPADSKTSVIFNGTYTTYNKNVKLNPDSSSIPALDLSDARFKYLENNPDYNYALVFDSITLYNLKETAKKGKKVSIGATDSVILESREIALSRKTRCKLLPHKDSSPYAFKMWMSSRGSWARKTSLSEGYPVTLIARSQDKEQYLGKKDYWYFISFMSMGPDDLEPLACWIHGSSVSF